MPNERHIQKRRPISGVTSFIFDLRFGGGISPPYASARSSDLVWSRFDLETHNEAESHSAKGHTLNESGRQDHVAHDITLGLGLASDALKSATADAADTDTSAHGSQTSANN